jgi:D-3-phosphoglycerate dehydrogenase / 2-oxoglutarate reductase
MKGKIIFIDSVHPILQERLTAHGFVCDLHYKTPLDEVKKILPEYTGLVLRSRFTLNDQIFEHAPNLRFIARSGSGLENIDLKAAERRQIRVFSSPEGNKDAVGEHALGLLLSLFNHLNRASSEVKRGIWLREENRGIELAGKTVGLIGYGHMGQSLAKKLSGMDCHVIAYDKYHPQFPDSNARSVDLPAIYRESDVVSLHLPLSEETMQYANKAFFDGFHKPIFFLNTSRGQHVVTADLAEALKEKKVLGAGLDVLEYEKKSLEGLEFEGFPEALQYLVSCDNVLLTPHVAGWTQESYVKLSSVLADKILAEF